MNSKVIVGTIVFVGSIVTLIAIGVKWLKQQPKPELPKEIESAKK